MPYLNNQSEKSEMANLTASYFRKSSIFLIWDNTSGCANQPRVLNNACSVMLSRPASRSPKSVLLDRYDALTRFQNIVSKRKNSSNYWRLYGRREVSKLDVVMFL